MSSEPAEDFPATIKVLTAPGGVKVYILGTDHFNDKSVRDVASVICRLRPKSVVVELCRARGLLLYDEKEEIQQEILSLPDFRQLVRLSGVSYAITQYLMQRIVIRITELMEIVPGGEFRAGVYYSVSVQCHVDYGDRWLAITWKRAMAQMSLWAKLKMYLRLLRCVCNFTKEEAEAMKQTDIVTELLAQMTEEYPALKQVVFYERYQYLAKSIWNAAGDCLNKYQSAQKADNSEEENKEKVESAEKDESAGDEERHCHHSDSTVEEDISKFSVVAVVSNGNMDGIVDAWENAENICLSELNRFPPPSSLSCQHIGFALNVTFFSAFAYGGFCLLTKIVRRISPSA